MSNIDDDLLSESQVIELKNQPDIEIVQRTQIIEIDPATQVTHVRDAGPVGPPSTAPGPKGDEGDVGPQGPPGIASQWYESPGAVTVWDIPHGLDHDPSVEVRDSTNRVCLAPIQYFPGHVIIDITPSNISLKAKLTP